MAQIAKLGIGKTEKLLKEQGYEVEVSDLALDQLAKEGYDPVYGARPLRRLIQNSIENGIAIALISKQFVAGDTIKIDYDSVNQKYTFVKGVPKTPPLTENNQNANPTGQPGEVANGVATQPSQAQPTLPSSQPSTPIETTPMPQVPVQTPLPSVAPAQPIQTQEEYYGAPPAQVTPPPVVPQQPQYPPSNGMGATVNTTMNSASA